MRELPAESALIDGEAIACRPDGYSSFLTLRTRRGAATACIVAFDFLEHDGEDLRLLLVFHTNEATFQTAWFMISLLTELAVVLVLRTHKPSFQSSPSRLLVWSTLAVGSATLSIPFLGPLSSAFGFVPLSGLQLSAVIAILLGFIIATEVAKSWFFRESYEKRAR